MEPSELGVILDSSVLIEAERQRLDVTQFLELARARIGELHAALCSISVAELAHGVFRAETPERRRARREFLDGLKATIEVYPITADTAEVAGREDSCSGVAARNEHSVRQPAYRRLRAGTRVRSRHA
jgi:predicted nucleic acid-binding protein